jgi:putative colanic acid biosynthesis acetyltransferase WcaF
MFGLEKKSGLIILQMFKLAIIPVFSQGALLLTGNHNYKRSSFDLMVGEIILEEGVWIGAKSIVAPGVTCGSHSVTFCWFHAFF